MVLDNAASGTEPSPFTDSTSTSDLDPYASSGSSDYDSPATRNVIQVTPPGTSNPIFVNLEALPRPFSLTGSKPHPPLLYKGIAEQCRYAQEILGRPVKQEEADALAQHFARGIRMGSYGTPMGVALGTIQCVRRQSELRFPGGFSPMKSERFSSERLGPLQGRATRAGWNMLRIAAYWSVGGFVGGIVFGVYALSSASAARLLDPRLREFSEAVKNRMQSQQRQGGASPGGRQRDESDGPRRDETNDMARQRRIAQGKWRGKEGAASSSTVYDDMSPTGGAFQEDFVVQQGSGGDSGMMDDSQLRQRDARQQQQEYATASVAEAGASIPTTSSPTPSRRPVQDRQAVSSASGRGSAWDRVRQGAMGTGGSSSSQRQGRSNADAGDSFSFSQGEDDKQLARSEARREFDAKMERERAGKDFENRGNGGGRW